jgi:fumarylacetoacetase
MPARRSFIPVAVDGDFPLQNLPFGVYRPRDGTARVGVAIGDQVLDLAALWRAGRLAATGVADGAVFEQPALNAYMALGPTVWRSVRNRLTELLAEDGDPSLREDDALRSAAFVPQAAVTMLVPAEIGDYTDFYSSRDHATNVGSMFRGADQALMPNWLHLPVGYHGRSSSIVVSGTSVRRPLGQTKDPADALPRFGATRELDFELEVGAIVGRGNALGEAIPAASALDHVFGLVLVNDWSARDIQRWEYVPLGPFLAKNFATTVSPWVVGLEALEPFRVAGPAQDDPRPLPYLRGADRAWYDVTLEVWLQSAAMRAEEAGSGVSICRTSFRHMYWSLAQQIAHHTVGGCNLRTGDLLASGTISGPTAGERGSLLELAWRGSQPIRLPTGEQRSFLEDGDRLTIRGWCQGDGYRIGLGECSGEVLPARADD